MSEFAKLRHHITILLDRQDILDCVNRYCRGFDRHDSEILKCVYHEDAVDEHGFVVNNVAEYTAWVNALHSRRLTLCTHNITTHSCELHGDSAHSESYVLHGLLRKSDKKIWFGGGRYLDRLEKRHGEWRIVARRTIIDWMLEADGSSMSEPYFVQQGYPSGTNDKTDISYERPLRFKSSDKR